MAEQYCVVWTYCILFIVLSFDGHLGCFQLLTIVNSGAIQAIVNSGAIHIHAQVFA